MESVRLENIEKSLAPIFRALPKNNQGRLSAPVMRYSVQRYFSQQYGWVVKGFEPHALAANISDTSGVMQSKLPEYIRTALEEKFAQSGFSLKDVAVMVAAVERLTFDEVIRGIELAFQLNNLDTGDELDLELYGEVLISYMVTEMFEAQWNSEGRTDQAKHAQNKESIVRMYPHWHTTLGFMSDLIWSEEYESLHRRNPFTNHDELTKIYTFDDAARIGQRISEVFGSWSNHECHDIKDPLVKMDVKATGRVKLSEFYGSSQNGGGGWQYLEAPEYLRQLGALDDSSTRLGPQVIIANYVAGMSNCITSTPYYSICCLNHCDEVYQHLEAAIPASTASPAEIIHAVETMPDTSFIEAWNVSASLRSRLEEVAAVHNGKIPLHGRLMAQWLHYAFPRDCPFPHEAGTVNPQTPVNYKESMGLDTDERTAEEIEQFLQAEAAQLSPSPDAGIGMWNLKEHVMESSTASDHAPNPGQAVIRTIASLGLLTGLLGLLWKHLLPQVLSISRGSAKKIEYDV